MTNRIAFSLAFVIALVAAADLAFADGSVLLFLVRHLADLVQTLAVWR